MKIYVVICDMPDYTSEVEKAFTSKEDAEDYCILVNDEGPDYEFSWVETELDG